MNSVTLIGRLTDKPEVSYTQSQKAVCRFTLAVDRMKEGTDFIRIVVWDKQAENCERFLGKGSKCGVNGRIQTGSYKDKDGKMIYTTDVVATYVEFLDSKTDRQPQAEAQVSMDTSDLPDSFSSTVDSIPF